jgi:LmbE family N-acetylglucosaminyl deacetylase
LVNHCDDLKSIFPGKRILILAPHQDDEALMCSGIIEHAITNGAEVKVCVVTNGDKKGRKIGLIRIRETIKAMNYLGLSGDSIVFLGYGNTTKVSSAAFLNRLYNAATDTTVIPSYVGTQTYSIPEAPEYHYYKYGTHGVYNRETFRQDLKSVIDEYRPDQIYVTSLYDTHPDHSNLYKFTVESIISIKHNNPQFSPIMYECLIHPDEEDDLWPVRERGGSRLASFSKPLVLETNTLLDWEKREVFMVPLNMQSVWKFKNKKHKIISKYRSQRPWRDNNYLYSYVKADEFFWKKDFANIAFLANVNVSSENTSTGQLGIKAIDGIADGYPRFPDNEWATTGEIVGAWIQLSWLQKHKINRIVLYDRPNLIDNINSATLTFSDGSAIKVGLLPNNGSGCEINFVPKIVNWVKLTIDEAVGKNTGLSEFEVYEVKR